MTFSFFDFTMAVTKWLSTAPDEAASRNSCPPRSTVCTADTV